LEILYFDELSSTQEYALLLLKSGKKPPFAINCIEQTSGIGSRGSAWEGSKGALYLSVAVHRDTFPKDLPMCATALFLSFCITSFLRECGSKAWMKWPNDIYIEEKKIGGVIAKLHKDTVVWGVGINRVTPSPSYGDLDIEISTKSLIEGLLQYVEGISSWKQIFRKIEVEFSKSKKFKAHIDGELLSLSDAKILEDGSLDINGSRKFSLR